MGVFKRLQLKKETGQYITEDEKRFISMSLQEFRKMQELEFGEDVGDSKVYDYLKSRLSNPN